VTETLEALKAQDDTILINQTMKKYKELVSLTGVKDPLRAPLQNALLEDIQRLKTPAPGQQRLTKKEVEQYMLKELNSERSRTLINPLLLEEGLDVHKDTPVEPLHTFLLGIVKYFWNQTIEVVKEKSRLHILCSRLNSIDVSGLNTSPIQGDYLIKFSGGLIGKHFKALAQIMPFACYDFVSAELFQMWLSIGRLGVLLWETEIDQMTVFKVC
jgi:hypothetical protein